MFRHLSKTVSKSHLNLLFYELLGVVDLLRGASDDEQFEVWVSVWRGLTRYLHEGAGLLVDGLDVLSPSADDEAAFVSGDGEGDLPSGGAPAALASAPSSPTRGHPSTARGALRRKH